MDPRQDANTVSHTGDNLQGCTIPYVPYAPPLQPGTTPLQVSWSKVTTTPTVEEKAEVVLAMLLGRVDELHSVVLQAVEDEEDTTVYTTEHETVIAVPSDLQFADLIHELYVALACPRGRALR